MKYLIILLVMISCGKNIELKTVVGQKETATIEKDLDYNANMFENGKRSPAFVEIIESDGPDKIIIRTFDKKKGLRIIKIIAR